MVALRVIARRHQIRRPGPVLCAPRYASWLVTRCWPAQYQQSYGVSGLPSKLRAGSNARSLERRTNRCHTRRLQARGVLKKELLAHLRAKRTVRRSQHASLKRNGNGQIKDAVSISERPASVEDRAVPGHWEGDLIGGSKNSYVATLVERHSRYVMLVKVANKDTEVSSVR